MTKTGYESESWKQSGGAQWVNAADLMDRLLIAYLDRLMDTVGRLASGRVLDIGCGTGATTRSAATILGNRGDAVGLDISPEMIEEARRRAREVGSAASFVLDDASSHAFAPNSFDLLISRFGVMFFEDPVAAFANLRRAVRPGGHLHMITWRGPEENAFMIAAEEAAREHVPQLPVRQTGEPGQFGLADRDQVTSILSDAGWSRISLEPADEEIVMSADELDNYLVKMGPVGRIFDELDANTQVKLAVAIRAAFAPYREGDEVRFTASCWSVRAEAGEEG